MCLIACYVSYTSLLNVLYGLNSYLEFAFIAFMLVNNVHVRLRKK